MPITRSKKEEVVKNIQGKVAKAKVLVFARFHGLSVAKATTFRRAVRALEADFSVAKKSLLRIAFRAEGKEIPGELDGEVGLVAGRGEELPLFKAISDFAKKEKDAFQILGGFYEGKYIDAATAKALGQIPSREALLAQLMGVIQGNTRKLLYVLDQMSKKS
ncbi:MAG: 50S ribosomal protein L10 [Patescibacteria group bacterium]